MSGAILDVMGEGSTTPLSQDLLLSVAEELKLPLTQIARQAEHAELAAVSGKVEATEINSIRTAADTALRLLDNYALGVRLHTDPAALDAEPVSVSSILYDTGQQLDAMAKSYGVELELHIAGRYGTVMAHRRGLQAALASLGAALIEALPAQQQASQLKLQLATHRSRYGIVAGVYGDTPQLTKSALARGRRLRGHGRQPLTGISHTSAAGIFVADSILSAMNLHLSTSRHHNLYGLGTVLSPNQQTRLV